MKKIFFAAVMAAIFFVCSICSAYAPEGKLYLTMLDIGQGDAFLIETPTQNILIDTGDVDTRRRLVRQLNNAGITRLEKIILSHPHSDHIGGVKAILDNFPVDEIIDNGIASTNPLYAEYRSYPVMFTTAISGDVIDFGGGVKFRVFSPSADMVRAVNSKAQRGYANNESIVGKLIFGEFSIIFTGDAEQKLEESLFETYQFQLKSTILKASHHGSRTSSHPYFVAAVSPTYVIISAGKLNKFGHPHKQALATYRENAVLPENIFCTRFNGTVRIESDGKNQVIIVEKENDWVVDYTKEKITVQIIG